MRPTKHKQPSTACTTQHGNGAARLIQSDVFVFRMNQMNYACFGSSLPGPHNTTTPTSTNAASDWNGINVSCCLTSDYFSDNKTVHNKSVYKSEAHQNYCVCLPFGSDELCFFDSSLPDFSQETHSCRHTV
jgi:hypothetical protein